MAKDFSFDIISDFDIQEMNNALDQTKRELATRYDFKGTSPEIDFEEAKSGLIINVDSSYKLTALLDILESKMIKRDLSLKILDKSTPEEEASGGRVRKKIPFKKGLKQEDAKKITKLIREEYPKIKASIQGDSIRVSGNSKDDLQSVMQLLRSNQTLDMPLEFQNFK
jgi:cyclic-di-GMP-binding protein